MQIPIHTIKKGTVLSYEKEFPVNVPQTVEIIYFGKYFFTYLANKLCDLIVAEES